MADHKSQRSTVRSAGYAALIFCLQNQGTLSSRKRAGQFDFLSDEEVAAMERVVQLAFESETGKEA